MMVGRGAAALPLALLALLLASQAAVGFKPSSLDLSVGDGGKGATVSYPAAHPTTLQLSPSGSLKASMQLPDGAVPQQLMIQVESAETGRSVYFAGKVSSAGKATFEVSPASIAKVIGAQGGKYAATLLVGDAAIPAPVSWAFATLDVSHAADAPPASPPFLITRTTPRAEIHHVFNQPEKRPAAVISLVFAVAAAVPTVAFSLLALPSLGLKLGGLSAKGIAFHGVLAAMLATLLLFWTSLNLLQTLPILAALGVGALLTGHTYLQDIAARRLKAD
eukprot:jgi/Tetstr1/435122/TSEL_024090.t1